MRFHSIIVKRVRINKEIKKLRNSVFKNYFHTRLCLVSIFYLHFNII